MLEDTAMDSFKKDVSDKISYFNFPLKRDTTHLEEYQKHELNLLSKPLGKYKSLLPAYTNISTLYTAKKNVRQTLFAF